MIDGDIDAKVRATRTRRFNPPWRVERIPGGFKVLDANGQWGQTNEWEI